MGTFGTSTTKYSLNRIVGKPQVVARTAQDVNRLLGTAAASMQEVKKIQDDEQAYELNTKYNQIQRDYHNAMTNAGDDLEALTKAYDDYHSRTTQLMDDTSYDPKVRTRFTQVALNDIGKIRSKHDAIRMRYVKDRFSAKVATDAMTYKSLPTSEKQQWFKDKVEVGKLTGLNANESAQIVISNLLNTYKVALSTGDVSLEQIKSMKQDFLELAKADPKLKGKNYYEAAVQTMDEYEKNKRTVTYKNIDTAIQSNPYDFKDNKQLIESSELDKNQKIDLLNKIKKQEFVFQVKTTAFSTEAQVKNTDVSLDLVSSAIKNRLKIDPTYTKEQADYDLKRAKDYRKRVNDRKKSKLEQAIKEEAKRYIGHLKSTRTYDDPNKVSKVISLLPYSQSNETFFRRNNVGYSIEKNGVIADFDGYKKQGLLYDTDAEWYKSEAKRYVSKNSQMLLSDNPKDLAALGGMVKLTRQLGNVPTVVASMLNKPDLNKAEGVQQLTSNIKKIDTFLKYNPDMTKQILGTSEQQKKFYLYKAMLLSTSESGNSLTADEIQKTKDILAGNISLKGNDKINAFNYFDKHYTKAGQNYKAQQEDLETFYNLKLAGVSDSDAIDQINAQYKVAQSDRYSLVGVDPNDPKYKNIDDTLDYIMNNDNVVNLPENKDAYFTVDPNTGHLLVGTKEVHGMEDTLIPVDKLNDVVAMLKNDDHLKENYDKLQDMETLKKTNPTLYTQLKGIKETENKVASYVISNMSSLTKHSFNGAFGFWKDYFKQWKTFAEMPFKDKSRLIEDIKSVIKQNGITQFMEALVGKQVYHLKRVPNVVSKDEIKNLQQKTGMVGK